MRSCFVWWYRKQPMKLNKSIDEMISTCFFNDTQKRTCFLMILWWYFLMILKVPAFLMIQKKTCFLMMQANSGPTLPSSGVVSASPPKIMVALKKSLISHYFVWLDMARSYLWTGRYVLDCPCRPPTVSPKCPCWSQVGLPCVSNAKKYILILNKRSSGKITGFSHLGAQLYSNWFILLLILNYVWLTKIPQEHDIDTFSWEDSSRMPPSAPVWIIFGCEKRRKLYFSWDLTP